MSLCSRSCVARIATSKVSKFCLSQFALYSFPKGCRMNRAIFPSLIFITLVLSGCARMPLHPWNQTDTVAHTSNKRSAFQTPEFEIGTSSNSVERLAKEQSCHSDQGAGLLAQSGPVEMYRIKCDDGRSITARCELRQCSLVSQ